MLRSFKDLRTISKFFIGTSELIIDTSFEVNFFGLKGSTFFILIPFHITSILFFSNENKLAISFFEDWVGVIKIFDFLRLFFWFVKNEYHLFIEIFFKNFLSN